MYPNDRYPENMGNPDNLSMNPNLYPNPMRTSGL